MSNSVEEDPATGLTGDLATVADVLDRASVPVGLLGVDGEVLYTNESFARACGRPAGELLGVVLANSVVADDRMGLHSALAALHEGTAASVDDPGPAGSHAAGGPTVADIRFVGADGRVRPARANLALLAGDLVTALSGEDAPPRDRLVMCIVTDRSEERRSERSDRRSRVTEATAAMTDPVTGLLNSRGIDLTLESASRRAGRNDAAFALIHCTVEAAASGSGTSSGGSRETGTDHGEALLMACVDRIRQRLRPSDTVARSGDAVMVVAEDLGDEQDAAGVTYRILSTVVEPVRIDDDPVVVEMHAGTVVADGSTPVHRLVPAAAEAVAVAVDDGGFELVDMRR